MMKRVAQLARAMLATTALIASPLALNTAEAATATCTKAGDKSSRVSNPYWAWVPLSSGGSENCLRKPHGSPALNATVALQFSIKYCYKRSLGNSGTDDIYGAKTIAGIRHIRDKVDVSADGVYGKQTHNKMKFSSSLGRLGMRPSEEDLTTRGPRRQSSQVIGGNHRLATVRWPAAG